MYKVFGILLTLCLFQDTIAYCCFRDVYPTPCCSDLDTYGIFYSPCTSPCGVASSCSGVANSCFRDVSNVCAGCDNSPCSCSKGSCGGCGDSGSCGGSSSCGGVGSCGVCGNSANVGCGGSYVYFPEVEYPVVAVQMKPFYYGSCFCA